MKLFKMLKKIIVETNNKKENDSNSNFNSREIHSHAFVNKSVKINGCFGIKREELDPEFLSKNH